jgi:hypothetical protein
LKNLIFLKIFRVIGIYKWGFQVKGWSFQNQGSFQKVMAPFHHQFFRNQSQMRFHFKKKTGYSIRRQPRENKTTNQFSALTKNLQSMAFSGRGDSTKIFVELGY